MQLFNAISLWTIHLVPVVIAQKMKFSIKDFLSKCNQIRRKLQICSHLLEKSLMENFIFLCSGSFILRITEIPIFDIWKLLLPLKNKKL